MDLPSTFRPLASPVYPAGPRGPVGLGGGRTRELGTGDVWAATAPCAEPRSGRSAPTQEPIPASRSCCGRLRDPGALSSGR